MTTEQFRRKIIEEKYLKQWTTYCRYKDEKRGYIVESSDWLWNQDGTLDIKGDIEINNFWEPMLPVKFKKVQGTFFLWGRPKTLYGMLVIVEGDFIMGGCGYKVSDIKKICKVSGKIY